MPKKRVLFLCTGNSCRSQIAEGFGKKYLNSFDVYSAGIIASGLNQYAVEVMKEIGIDISCQKSKTIDALCAIEFDYVITLCDNAKESCPLYPAKTKIVHHVFDDPYILALNEEDENKKIMCFRRVRDEIKDFIIKLKADLCN